MDSGAGPRPDSSPDPEPLPLTLDLLADLQAGLLDDATAARVRRRARNDPEAERILAGLDTVRRELARLGSEERSAPDVPATVTAAVGAALRTTPRPRGRPRPAATPAAPGAVGRARRRDQRCRGHGRPRCTHADPRSRTRVPVGTHGCPDDRGGDGTHRVPDVRRRTTRGTVRAPGSRPPRRPPAPRLLPHRSRLLPRPEVLGARQLSVSGRPAVLLLVPGGASGADRRGAGGADLQRRAHRSGRRNGSGPAVTSPTPHRRYTQDVNGNTAAYPGVYRTRLFALLPQAERLS